jgi:transcriptional regulator NrdR family protein
MNPVKCNYSRCKLTTRGKGLFCKRHDTQTKLNEEKIFNSLNVLLENEEMLERKIRVLQESMDNITKEDLIGVKKELADIHDRNNTQERRITRTESNANISKEDLIGVKKELADIHDRDNTQERRIDRLENNTKNIQTILQEVQSELLDNTLAFNNVKEAFEKRGLTPQQAEFAQDVVQTNLQVQNEKQLNSEEIKKQTIQPQLSETLQDQIRRGHTLRKMKPVERIKTADQLHFESLKNAIQQRRSSVEPEEEEIDFV